MRCSQQNRNEQVHISRHLESSKKLRSPTRIKGRADTVRKDKLLLFFPSLVRVTVDELHSMEYTNCCARVYSFLDGLNDEISKLRYIANAVEIRQDCNKSALISRHHMYAFAVSRNGHEIEAFFEQLPSSGFANFQESIVH